MDWVLRSIGKETAGLDSVKVGWAELGGVRFYSAELCPAGLGQLRISAALTWARLCYAQLERSRMARVEFT